MSNLAISSAMETKLKSIDPVLFTAWENVNFKPQNGLPYQEAFMLFAKPENPTMGDDFFRQRGYLQVDLLYQQNIGKKAAFERAELIRQTFSRGTSLTAYGITTIVETTPEISGGKTENSRWKVSVFVYFFANIGGSIPTLPPEPPETGSENMLEKITGQAIGALKAVRLNAAGLALIADKDDNSVETTVGLSVTAAGMSSPIFIQVGGEVTDGSWNWQPGTIFLGDNGTPTQIAPETGAVFKLGIASGPNSMVIEPEFIAQLS